MLHRAAATRGLTKIDWLTSYHTFSFGDYQDANWRRFNNFRVLNDDYITPGSGFPTHGHQDMEIITLVLSGGLAHRDSTGGEGVILPGEVQVMTAGTGIRHSEFNASTEAPGHFLQLWVFPKEKGLTPSYRNWDGNFLTKGESGVWQLAASVDGAGGSVALNADAAIRVVRLSAGQEVPLKIASPGTWLHVASGAVSVGAARLTTGDGLGLIPGNIADSVKAAEDSIVLAVDTLSDV